MSASRPPASELSALLADRVDGVVPTLLSKATRSGNYWHIGSVAGETGKSLFVLRTGDRAGWWKDTATGEHGDLLDLAGAVNGTDLRGACDWARSFLGLGDGDRDRVHHHDGIHHQHDGQHQLDQDDHRRIARAREIWSAAKPAAGSLVEAYLAARAITIPIPASIRYAPSLRHGPTGLDLPVMVAAVQSPDRQITAIHRTFLTQDGTRKAPVSPDKMTLGCCAGGAIRLGPAGPKIAIGEGLETSLSVAQRCPDLPVWCALNAGGIRSIILPAQVREVVLCPDADEPGEQAAQAAAKRFIAEDRAVRIARPPTGQDFNDLLQQEAANG